MYIYTPNCLTHNILHPICWTFYWAQIPGLKSLTFPEELIWRVFPSLRNGPKILRVHSLMEENIQWRLPISPQRIRKRLANIVISREVG